MPQYFLEQQVHQGEITQLRKSHQALPPPSPHLLAFCQQRVVLRLIQRLGLPRATQPRGFLSARWFFIGAFFFLFFFGDQNHQALPPASPLLLAFCQ